LGFPIQLSILCDRNLYEAATKLFVVAGTQSNKVAGGIVKGMAKGGVSTTRNPHIFDCILIDGKQEKQG